MPWIRNLRIWRWFWVAWTEDDFHTMRHQRLGFTADHAMGRVARTLAAREAGR